MTGIGSEVQSRPGRPRGRGDGREAALQGRRADHRRVEERGEPGLTRHHVGDPASDDVARGEFGATVDGRHEAAPAGVEEDGSLAADRLAHQERPGHRERRRVELQELEVVDGGARAPGRGEAVAGGDERVRRELVELPGAARGEHDGVGAELERPA